MPYAVRPELALVPDHDSRCVLGLERGFLLHAPQWLSDFILPSNAP